ncbi:recombinase family protein [Citrobacter farmeri]|uniref:recombinase family protein n=1 Tax=Citrobacter farmeri TaxID=67824 RepID=UPI00389105B2|nr:recombinase family protein [Citrobacter farmeri]
MAKLYSYIRWSSAKQTAGTSLSRQTQAARLYATEHGLEYTEILDAGVSAFKGKNSTQGALGSFIQAVKDGVIPSDSWLYVENLDRLTRQDMLTALNLFTSLLGLGLTIVTGMDKRVYTAESAGKDISDLMISLVMFSRANEESKTKQARANETARALVERFKQGHPTNIKVMGNDPWWFDNSMSKYEAVKPHPVHWAAAQKIVELFLKGWGSNKIASYLNSNLDVYPAPRPTRRRLITKWSVPNLVTMRKNPALMGTRKLTIQGTEHTLENYYPPLCTPEQFARIQDIRLSNRSRQGEQRNMISLLSGIGVLRCGLCGGPMIFYNKEGSLRYVCSDGKMHRSTCKCWSVRGDLLENLTARALIYGYTHSLLSGNTQTEDLTPVIESKQSELETVKTQLSNVTTAITTTGPLPVLLEQIKALSQREQALLLELDNLKQKLALQGSDSDLDEQIKNTLGLLTGELIKDTTHTDRIQIREVIRKCISRVTVTKSPDLTLKFDFLFPDDSHLIYQGVRNDGEKSYMVTRTPQDQIYSKIAGVLSDALGSYLSPSKVDGYTDASDRMIAVLGLSELSGGDFFGKR